MILILAMLLLIDPDDPQEGQMAILAVAEARAVVELYEGRVETSKLDITQAELVRDFRRGRVQRLYHLYSEKNAVTLGSYLESKLDYDYAEIEVTRAKLEEIQSERNLKLARVRLQIAEEKQKEGLIDKDRKDVDDLIPRDNKKK